VSRPAIPDLKLRLGDSEEVREWNKMREAIISLARHPEELPRIHPPAPRQFQLFQGSDNKIRMREGILMFTQRANDGTSNASGVTGHSLSSWYLVPEVIGGAGDEKEFTVSASTDYGFWLKIKHTVSGNDTSEGRNSAVGNTQLDEYIIDTEVFLGDSSKVLPSTGSDLVGSTVSYSYIYLGKAVVDGDTRATITQNVFGPITVPAITYLDGLIEGTQSSGRQTFLGIGDARGITTTSNVESGSNDIFEAATGRIYLRLQNGEGGSETTHVEIVRESPEDGEPRVFLNKAKADEWDDKAGPVDTGSDQDHTHT